MCLCNYVGYLVEGRDRCVCVIVWGTELRKIIFCFGNYQFSDGDKTSVYIKCEESFDRISSGRLLGAT